jgi:hypothetical protein
MGSRTGAVRTRTASEPRLDIQFPLHFSLFGITSEKARNETRTRDPFLTMEVLYQLSYPGGTRRPLRGPQGSILEGLRGGGGADRNGP